jgi:hypothetical protein
MLPNPKQPKTFYKLVQGVRGSIGEKEAAISSWEGEIALVDLQS